jgi:hypothetical protein
VRFVSYLEKPSGSSGQCVVNVDDCELLEVAVPPSIIQPPTDQTVVEGSTVSFSITARGTPPLYYQWQFRETNLPGATDATLTLTAVTTNQAGPYAVFVSNAVGSTSAAVALTIPDRIRPALLSVSPVPNAVAAPPTAAVSANYNLPMNPGSVTPTSFAVHGFMSGANTNPALLSVVGARVTFSPSQPCKAGELVQATASTSLQATNGTGPMRPFVWQFRAATSQGTGLFTESDAPAPPSSWFESVAFGDVNGDGFADALVTSIEINSLSSMTQVLLNDGTGRLTNCVQTLNHFYMSGNALGDLDGDSDLDLIVGGGAGCEVWFNDGTGHFTKSGLSLGSSTGGSAVGLADFDGDGDLDAATGAVVLLNDGHGSFVESQPLGGVGAVMAAADLNDDGFPDLVFGVSSGRPTNQAIWFNDGTGHFTDTWQSLGADVRSVLVGDLDGDGHSDLLVATGSGSWACSVWLNDGHGTFLDSGQRIRTGESFGGMALGDINHDGHLDAIISVAPGGSLFWTFLEAWVNDGHGHFTRTGQQLLSRYSQAWWAASLVDLNNDGALDLFASDGTYNQVWLAQTVAPRIVVDYAPAIPFSANLRGHVIGLPAGTFAIATFDYLEGIGLYPKPTCASPLTPINPDGTFEVDFTTGGIDHLCQRITLLLVAAGTPIPCVLTNACIPEEVAWAALAKVVVLRDNPGQRRIQFSGYNWLLKSYPVPAGPGPNYWSESTNNAWVDGQGRLHLRITYQGGQWQCPELISERSFGYGHYVWELDSPPDLDPNAVLGLFTWNNDCAFTHREIDVELSRWGNAADPNNSQFVVQPWDAPNHRLRYPLPNGQVPAVHRFLWESNQVSFLSLRGGYSGPPNSDDILQSWVFTNSGAVPQPEAGVRMNLWLRDGLPPADGQEIEVICKRFAFASLSGPELWAERTATGLGLKWLAEFPGCTVEQAATVNGPWIPAIVFPTLNDGFFTATLPFGPSNLFFRLRK